MTAPISRYSRADLAWAGLLPGQRPVYGRVALDREHPLAQGLEFVCRFSEGAGRLAYDLSGIHTGVAQNTPEWTSMGMDFELYDLDAIVVTSIPPYSSASRFSVVCAAKLETQLGTASALCGTMSAANEGWSFNAETYQDTARVGFTLRGVADYPCSSLVTPANGVRAEYGLSVNGNSVTAYLNGLTQTVAVGTMLPNTGGLVIGCGHRNGTQYLTHFDGIIDHFHLFRRNLQIEDIACLHANPNQVLRPIRVPLVIGGLTGYTTETPSSPSSQSIYSLEQAQAASAQAIHAIESAIAASIQQVAALEAPAGATAQTVFAVEAIAAAALQSIHALESAAAASRQTVYAIDAPAAPTLQAIVYLAAEVARAITRQVIWASETPSAATLQQIAALEQAAGALRQALYGLETGAGASRQSVYATETPPPAPTAQQIAEIAATVAATLQSLYGLESVDAATRQRIIDLAHLLRDLVTLAASAISRSVTLAPAMVHPDVTLMPAAINRTVTLAPSTLDLEVIQ